MNRRTKAKRSIHKALCESLEDRQLMSLTIEVRNAADGTAAATVTSVGHVVNLEVLAIITDPNGTPTEDGFQDATGSFVSSANGSASVAGSLKATNIAPFNADGAAPGTVQDLNGDGNLDVGSNSDVTTTDYFFARSSPFQSSSTGTIVGHTLEFKIATLTYTVTSLSSGGQTSINFVPYVSLSPDAAGWVEDASTAPRNGQLDNTVGTFQAGTAFTLQDPTMVTAPVAVNDSVTVAKNTATTINELKNDTVIDPLNLSSVTPSTPAHGTVALQADGSLLYTPATGYVGADSFTYTVADNGGRVSNAATVSINVVATPAPTAGPVADTTYLDQPITVNVLSADTSVGTLTPSSVSVSSAPAHGTAVAQTDGTILYTPSNGYLGTDTFTYTVSDSNNETSAPATVTITTAVPTPPTAVNDTFSTTINAPISLDVLANDSLGSITSAPKVFVSANPAHGTAVVQSDNTILYTPNTGYLGADTLDYVIVTSVGEDSSPATVSLTVTPVQPPTAGAFTAPVLSTQANTIDLLANTSGASTIAASGIAIASQPANGSVVLNTDGTASYTPDAGYLGADSFTYTATDANGQTSSAGTVTVDVGTSISNARGAAHSLSYSDSAGGQETISLNKGVAEIFFSGTGALTIAKNLKATVTGSGLNIGSIQLSGTTQASSLSIKGSVKTPTTVVNGITSSTLLGSINAPSANFSGIINLPSVGSMNVGTISNATLTIGAGVPKKFALTSGAVTNTTLTSAVPITTIKSPSWSGGGSITAPSITSLVIAGGFDPNLTLSAVSPKPVLSSARITGALDGTWSITSPVASITAGSVASTWVGPTGSLSALTVKGGGFAAALTSGVVGSITITGDLTGTLTATSAKAIRVTGNITNATVDITAGNLGSLTAATLTGSKIIDDADTALTVINATAGSLGTATLGSIRLTSKAAGAFAASTILADKIGSASLGTVTTDNSGTAFGIATTSLGSFAGTFGDTALHLNRTLLNNQAVLSDYLTQKGVIFADFTIAIV